MQRKAFVSYASRYRDWAQALHRNLSSVLGDDAVFFDQADLRSGRSWIAALQEAVSGSARLVLVSSPEAFASPWVRGELDGFQASCPDWKARGLIQVALLVDTPLPPFLASAQQVDFRHHDGETYRERFRSLAAALADVAPADLALPDELEIPQAPSPDLPNDLRQRAVQLLVPLFQKRYVRTLVEEQLEIPRGRLEGHSSAPLAVSAALAQRRDGRAPERHAGELLQVILGQELAEEPGLAEELRQLSLELQELEGPRTSEPKTRLPKPVALHHPTGTVPRGSELYIRREADATAQRQMDQRPGLVHLLGPRQAGKSSLLARLAELARSRPGGALVIEVNFQDLGHDCLSDLRELLFQLAWIILDAAGRDPDKALRIRDTPLTPALACKNLVATEVLAHQPQGVLLAMDEVERVLLPDGCARDFFAMLRSWHETGKRDARWEGLRIALVFCTEAYLTLDDGGPESPLENVGERCRLRDFERDAIEHLVELHGLEADPAATAILENDLGGNPYLVRHALYAAATDGIGLETTLTQAREGEGPLGGHLHRHLRHLRQRPQLARAMAHVLQRSLCPDPKALRPLEGAGLVTVAGSRVTARYPVYADFLRPRL